MGSRGSRGGVIQGSRVGSRVGSFRGQGWGQGWGHSGDKGGVKGGVIQGTKGIKIISKKSAIALDMIFIHFFRKGRLKSEQFRYRN